MVTELKESNVSLKLTVVDTVGFGDQIDKSERGVYLRRAPARYVRHPDTVLD